MIVMPVFPAPILSRPRSSGTAVHAIEHCIFRVPGTINSDA